MADNYQHIIQATDEGRLDDATQLINDALRQHPDNAYLIYLKGNICMKRGQWGQAISMFLQAENIDPQCPAAQARRMLNDIMNFYNKDMYNH